MDLGLRDKVVLVTGSSQGIGRAAAVAFGAEGARVGVTYHRERDRAEAVVEAIKASGGDAVAFELDLARHDTIHQTVGAMLERWGRVDVLVNNALVANERPTWESQPLFEELDPGAWQAHFRANTEGPVAAIQAVVPSMRANGWGRIVNISSGIVDHGMPGMTSYGAAKASLHGLTRTLYRELGPAGILVNVVMPGPTITEKLQETLPPDVRRQRDERAPLGRLRTADDVAPTIVFLCSAANTAVTGEVVRASGGYP